MITSLFSKSKSINFLIVFAIALLAFLVAATKNDFTILNATKIVKLTALLVGVFFSISILSFIVDKNNLSLKSNYEILLFSLFFLLIPQTTNNGGVLLSNCFVLLAIRRMLSVHSKKRVKQKLFDAALLIGIASLFYFWSILFFGLIFVAIFLYQEVDIKNWIVPFLGIIAVYITTIASMLLINEDYFNVEAILPRVSFDITKYNLLRYIVGITMLVSFGLWSSLFFLKDLRKKKKTYRPSYKVIFFASMIATFIVVISPDKDGSEFLFLFAPLAVIISNYIETIKDKWFKELFLLCMVIIPLALLAL